MSHHINMATVSKQQILKNLNVSKKRIFEETGKTPILFAYPYGYASNEAIEIIRSSNFKAAFGQHSGAISAKTNRYYMSRFPFTEKFGNIDRFKLAVNSLPLPISDITPLNPLLSVNPPLYGFTITDYSLSLKTLACYAPHEGRLHIEQLGKRIEVRMKKPFPEGGSGRINCTLQRNTDNKWLWFGYQYFVPKTSISVVE